MKAAVVAWLVSLAVTGLVAVQQLPQASDPQTLCKSPGCRCDMNTIKCSCSIKNQELVMDVPKNMVYIASIEIKNCHKVTVKKNSIHGISALRQVLIENAAELVVEEEGFMWGTTEILETYVNPGISLTLDTCYIRDLNSYAFKGQLNTIYLNKVKIDSIKAYAFSSLAGTERVELKDCTIANVEPQALKKFITDYFIIEGGSVGSMPSYSLIDVTARTELRIDTVALGHLKGQAFKVSAPHAFKLQNSRVEQLDGDAFKVTSNNVFISDNLFLNVGTGAFASVTVDTASQVPSGKQEFILENNTLVAFSDGSLILNMDGFRPTIDRIVLKSACSCSDIGSWVATLVMFGSSAVPGINHLMWCQYKEGDTVVEEYYEKNCTSAKSNVFVIVLGVLLGLIVLVVGFSAGYCLFRRHAKKYKPTNNRYSTCSGGSGHVMVVPEGKTYRETELHVIVERAEPIKEFKPPPPADYRD